MSIGDSPEILSQQILVLVGIVLVGRLGVLPWASSLRSLRTLPFVPVRAEGVGESHTP